MMEQFMVTHRVPLLAAECDLEEWEDIGSPERTPELLLEHERQCRKHNKVGMLCLTDEDKCSRPTQDSEEQCCEDDRYKVIEF